MTPAWARGQMAVVSVNPVESKTRAVRVVILVDDDAFERWHCVLRHLVVGLVDQGVSLRWLSPDPRVTSLALGPVEAKTYIPSRWPFRGRERVELLHQLERQAPTVVHAMSAGSYKLAGDIATAFDAYLVLGVSSLHDCDVLSSVDPSRVEKFVVASEPLVQVLVQHLRMVPEQVLLVRPGVQSGQAVTSFNDPDRTTTLLCTSPFEPHGGVEHLVEAIDALGERGHKMMAFLLGRGRQESMLRRMVRDRGLLGRVTFSPSMFDPISAMHGADVYVDTSFDPSFREHSLQAMGSGLVVVSRANASVDHLRDGDTARLCTRGSPQALIDTLAAVVGDPVAAHEMAVRAQQYAREHHAVSAMAERLATTYRQIAVARATFPLPE